MCVFITVYEHDFDVHTAFYPHVASCPPCVPSLPLNTMVLTTLNTTVPPGTTITIGCVDGYYTDREEILTCGSDGQWRGNITQCRGMGVREHLQYTNMTFMFTLHSIPIVYNLKSLHVLTLTTGTTSCNCPSTNTAVIIAPILAGMVMLLVGITLLVISVILIVKRKRHTPTVQYDKESKVQIYDEVNDVVESTKDTKVYQELDVNKMDDTKQ